MAPKLKCVGMKIDNGIDENTVKNIIGSENVGVYAERRGSRIGGYVGIRPLG